MGLAGLVLGSAQVAASGVVVFGVMEPSTDVAVHRRGAAELAMNMAEYVSDGGVGEWVVC